MWLGASHWNSGVLVPCCSYDSDVSQTTTWDNDINHRPYNRQRQMLVNGEKPKSCRDCWKNEAMGVISKRQEALNEDWWKPYIDTINHQTHSDGTFNHPPVYIDLRLGSKCNLACRMCNPIASSLIEKEIAENKSLFDPNGMELNEYKKAVRNGTTDFQINLVFNYLEKIKNPIFLKFTGGEPFLNKRLPDFLNRCIQTDRAKDISIMFITNLTTVQKTMIEQLKKHFHKVELVVSMEGIEDAYEYVRYPASWNKFLKNFKILQDLDIDFNISYTANSLTICEFVPWLNWVKENRCDWDLNPVIDPPYYNVSVLPNIFKNKIAEDLTLWQSNNQNYQYVHQIDGALGWLSQDQNSEDWQELKKNTIIKDKLRKQSIHRSIPKLADFL